MTEPLHSDRLNPDLEGTDAEEPLPFRAFTRRRVLSVLAALLIFALLLVVPPLVNVGRFRRQIASSLSASLGRPVHISSVTLNLLPLPGFTLENFVVGEDPAFGAEPVLRADEVRVTLRVASLWRRRLEFSRISLSDPSINLVHLPDGRWNFERILLRAAQIPAAPTAQPNSGDTPRFPYVEATGARLNLKRGVEKLPWSLTEGDLALWLSEPGQWRVRIKAHPTRTDTAVSDTGISRLDGHLGEAGTLAEVPLDLQAQWTAAPLGAVSQILTGRDLGLRGMSDLHATLQGTVGRNTLESEWELENLRRAEFVPAHSLNGSLRCTARLTGMFHTVDAAHCVWPGEAEGSGLSADIRVPDLGQPGLTTGTVQLTNIPAETLLDGARILSSRIAPGLSASGLLSGSLPCCGEPTASVPGTLPALTVPQFTLALEGQPPYIQQTVTASEAFGPDGLTSLQFAPLLLNLGGVRPATLTLSLSRSGATARLTGDALPDRLETLAKALPQFGDGLSAFYPASALTSDAPIHLDLTASHSWTQGQTWTTAPSAPQPAHPARARRRNH